MRAAIVFALALLCGCSRSSQTGSVHIDPVLVSLVPPDTIHLAGGNLVAVRNAPLAQRMLSFLPRIAEQTGLDPSRDLDEFLMASNGKDALLMFRGRFDSPEFQKHVKEIPGVVLLDNKTLLSGSKALIDSTLAHRNQPMPAPMTKLLGELPPNPQLWAVLTGGTSPVPLPQGGNFGNVEKIFTSLRSLVVAADVATGVKMNATAHCTDEAAAKQMHAALRAFIGLGRLSTPDNRQDLLKVYDAIQVEQKAADVRVEAALPQDLVESLVRLAPVPRR